jgi:glutathione synthase/RimK-type ligase-like ATP-grasp enzyme
LASRKPDKGSRGEGIYIFSTLKEARGFISSKRLKKEYIIQRFCKGKTIRIVASGAGILFAYEKISSDPVASVSQGGKKRHLSEEEYAQYEEIAKRATSSLGSSLFGIDLLHTKDKILALEANSSFALYSNSSRDRKNSTKAARWIKNLVD